MKYSPVQERIRGRINALGLPFFSNDNIAQAIRPSDIPDIVDDVASKMETVMQALLIDTEKDHNAKDTARRFAKMLVTETFKGRYLPEPDITEFPNVKQVDELYIVGPIAVRSACAHHLVPIVGSVWIGVLPHDKLIGLSKFHRTVDHIGSRPQIQEEMTEQIADKLEALTKPKGLAVLVVANHMCCGHRGVRDSDSRMVTSVLRGEMRTDKSLKAEFLTLVNMTK
jgi:GTP cyclohydrolase I